MCLGGPFNGAGDTWTDAAELRLLLGGQIPLAWVLAKPLGLGPTGIFIAVPISFSVLAAASGS
jgi:Na+-driven multidrug efflux pump